MTPHNPLMAAAQIQGMAGKASDERMAKLFTGLSLALVLMMIVREGREMVHEKRSWQEREHERRSSGEHAWGR